MGFPFGMAFTTVAALVAFAVFRGPHRNRVLAMRVVR